MKKLLFLICATLLVACQSPQVQKKSQSMSCISQTTRQQTIEKIQQQAPNMPLDMIQKGVNHAADFWMTKDGSATEFTEYCLNNYMTSAQDKKDLFTKLCTHLEVILGCYNKTDLALKYPLHVVGKPITSIDMQFGSMDPAAHFSDDLFDSKIAFTILLNFPFYALQEKNELGSSWTRLEWGYARMGDLFTSRVPAKVAQEVAVIATQANNYIDNYNIFMEQLRTDDHRQLFSKDKHLITHWGLRDELKSHYAEGLKGQEAQDMIYKVMQHIVYQDIPQEMISNGEYLWNPNTNEISKNGVIVEAHAEPNTRYQHLLDLFHANQQLDTYNPTYPTCLLRSFDEQMQVSSEDIEKLFIDLISSPEVKQVSQLIKQRLGRDLKPYDIWYDGFKSRSNLNEDDLTAQTRTLYPTVDAVQNALPNWLLQLGFTPEKAHFIASKVQVDASRGAGHAWGAQMKDDKAHLRTRVGSKGMDYKGYNIATHEFGHNVEQTITLHDVDYYSMRGVPSTAFTEALAFVFQKRDLQLLGYKNTNPNAEAMETLDIFWGCYEIMGVSLVDLYTWRWLYENPNCTVEEFKTAVLSFAKEVWNTYYAPYLGEKDSPILAVYSHMICIPLYLPNYPYGHIVQYQLEQQIAGKNIGNEVERIFSVGKLTPNLWMQNAAMQNVSTRPMIEATSKACKQLQ